MFDVKSLSFYFNKIDRWTLKEEKDIRYHLLFLSKIVKFWYFHFHLIFLKEDIVILSVKITKSNLSSVYIYEVRERPMNLTCNFINSSSNLSLIKKLYSFLLHVYIKVSYPLTWFLVKVIFCRQNKLQIYYFKVLSRCIR